TDALEGKAVLKLVRIHCGVETTAPRIDLALFLPTGSQGKHPVFLAMNFCGNHALCADPRIPLTRGWLYDSCKGCVENRATAAARGAQSGDWPIERILERGYALATFCTSDIDSDRKDVSDGVYAWRARQTGQAQLAEPADRGTISAWAWGFHRCVDYLVTNRRIDPRRIATVGHSRNGKTALLAAAFDERIALTIPHQAGCGGTAPSRGKIGESVKRINESFPHWFNGVFKKFNDQPERLPFDQNALVALCAPRPVLFSNAVEDQWANPTGQFEVLQAADPVYRWLKAGGLEATSMPELNHLVKSKLGYYIRPGKHSMTAGDWEVFLEFAEAHFGR
ncbi:MAG TPA: acetylxylan esterase, partial [Candidatus Dormibacteraeota bacterium]|nr:acetylxylan esterase [Candidatus Dormibacteraeota bacterium]